MKSRLLCRVIAASAFLLISSETLSGQATSKVEGLVSPKHKKQVITVGGRQADIKGYTSDAIQIALDAISMRGGGLVKLNPGKFLLISPVRLYSNITLIGSGKETVLQKCDGFRTNFILDVDYGMLKATVKDVSGFKVGMGIQMFDDEHKEGWMVTTAKITDIVGNIIENNLEIHELSKYDKKMVKIRKKIAWAQQLKKKIQRDDSFLELLFVIYKPFIYFHKMIPDFVEKFLLNKIRY